VRRHIECNNLCLLIVLLELKQVIALITIKNKQTIASNTTLFYMPIKVL
jgi:hypothetical protein